MANKRPALGVIAFAHLCELLVSRTPHSQMWFREQIGVSQNTMTKFMRVLKNHKLIYVAAWTHDGKRISTRIALWTWGYNQVNEPRPTPVPREIVNRNSKRRVRERRHHAKSQASFACKRSSDVRGDSPTHHRGD